MSTPVRTAGRYGRRSPKRAPALELGPLLIGAIPRHPAAEDYLAALKGGWLELGNDRAGDCNAVTWANMRRLVTATLAAEKYPTQAQVWQFYQTQNPGFDPGGDPDVNGPGSSADQGMDVQTGLEYLHAHGGPDGVKAVAFAKVNPAHDDEVEAALAIFGCLWLGVQVLDANPQEFTEGKPWTDVPGSAVEGGHAILGGGYGPSGIKFITWATETEFADSFWDGTAPDGTALVQEAWVVVWPEHLSSREFLAGINVRQLAADYRDLTGRELPVPARPAGRDPDEDHTDPLLFELAGHIRAVAGSAEKDIREVVAFLDSHGI